MNTIEIRPEIAAEHVAINSPAKLRITRTIVIEGTAKWAMETLSRSLVPNADDKYVAAYGEIRCSDTEYAESKDWKA